MSDKKSQSIASDRISDSTLVRAACNLMSGVPEDWINGSSRPEQRLRVVREAVATARLVADVVTGELPAEPSA